MKSQDDNPVRSLKAWVHSLELERMAVSALISGGIRPGMEENPFEYVGGDVFGDITDLSTKDVYSAESKGRHISR
jgi:hypothetical protein